METTNILSHEAGPVCTSSRFTSGKRFNAVPGYTHKSTTFTTLFAFLLLLFIQPLTAQITAGFELDGNANAVLPNPPDDWDLIYNHTSSASVTTGILSDAPSSADNAFVIGSKDIDDVSTWHWQIFSTPDKDDILNGGAALYNGTDLYFFADRYAQNGDAQIGFWFFKNQVAPLPNGTFSGTHALVIFCC